MRYWFTAAITISIILLVLPYGRIFSSQDRRIIGDPAPEATILEDSDVYDHVWHFWWVSHALEKGLDPRFCNLIYPPTGVSLVYHHIGWLDTHLFALSGISDLDPSFAFNLSLLLGSILTGLFGWFLARSWGADRFGALFTALAIVWLPSRMAHLLQHYQIANMWTLIATLWLCREYFKSRRRIYFAGFALSMLAAAFQSPFLAIFAAAGVVATAFISRAEWGRTAMAVLVVAVVMAVYWAFTVSSPGHPGSPVMDWRIAIFWSAEPQSFLLPSPFGLLGELTGLQQKVSWMPNAYEGVVTPGLTILTLFTYIVWKKKSWRLLTVVGILFILSLGPELRIFGRPLGIPLPFRLIQVIPVLNGIRAPSRFAILAGVIAAVGAGKALSMLKDRTRILFVFLLLLETTVISLPFLSAGIPDECFGISPLNTVIELPFNRNVRRYALFQTASGYTRQYAQLARFPDNIPELAELTEIPESADMLVYHRWLYEESERVHYDSVLADYFPGSMNEDSIWLYHIGGEQ